MPLPNEGRHTELRAALRVVGPVVIMVGVIFTVVGVGSFFRSFGRFEPPRYFWCAFVGMPLIALGAGISKFAFLGAASRYVANEVAPVGKDVFNYMADGTRSGVRDMAAAVGEGLRDGATVRCGKCDAENGSDANFCGNCGAPLRKACAACGEQNDPDARFCNRCGKGV